MKKVIAFMISIMGMLASCRHGDPSFREVRDKDLTFQISQMKDVGNDSSTISYRARLIPDKQLMESKTKREKDALYYHMDSCFYINDGKNKIYASMVQPVANGVAGNYEYLLDFEINDKQRQDSLSMTYQDKYINHQVYRLKLE